MGPLVSAEQHEKVSGFVAARLSAGATLGRGQRHRPATAATSSSRPCSPAHRRTWRCVREEIFGPVVVADPFDTVDEVVAAANNTVYGLAAGMWTKDLVNAHRVGARAAGRDRVDQLLATPTTSRCRFGGFKQSGWGRELGSFGLDDYTELKTVIAELR